MRNALVLAILASLAWGIGAVFLKRVADAVAPSTYIVFQYLLGAVLVGGWMAASGRLSAAFHSVAREKGGLVAAALLLVAGYLFFIAAVKYAGRGSIPTAAAIAIASAYPVIVALLSAPVLDEHLAWNHVAAITLVFGAVILAQL